MIVICTFDPFGADRYIYHCGTYLHAPSSEPVLTKDGFWNVFVNTRGRIGDVSDEYKALMHFLVDGTAAEGTFAQKLKCKAAEADLRYCKKMLHDPEAEYINLEWIHAVMKSILADELPFEKELAENAEGHTYEMAVKLRSASGIAYTTAVERACTGGRYVTVIMSTIATPEKHGPSHLFCERFVDSSSLQCLASRKPVRYGIEVASGPKYQKCPVMLSPDVAAVAFRKTPYSETEWYCIAL